MKRTYHASRKVSGERAQKVEKELKLGYINLEDGCFEQAKMNFLLVLEWDKDCADAYWGLMLEKFQLTNEDELFTNPVAYKSAIFLPECEKALALADKNTLNSFKSMLDKIYQINEGDKY